MHHEFYQLAKKISENNTNSNQALATVIHVRGSAYRREGTRMLIDSTGNWSGNISGGCLEGDILRKAKKVIESQKSMLLTYDTRESKNKEIRIALGCNGLIDVLIEPVNNEVRELCSSIANLFENESTTFVKTEIQINNSAVEVSHKISASIPATVSSSAFENENYCFVEKSDRQITLFEYLGLQRKMVIWGSGPDVLPVSNFATQLGWKTIVASDCGLERLEKTLPEREVVSASFNDFHSKTGLHSNTAVLLVSHDFYSDYFILEKIIQQDVKYIGIMGPKRRGTRMLEELKTRNPELQIDESKLHYPVGLDLGSDNPVEIALSIIAEVQSTFSGKDATPLKEKSTRIHNTGSKDEIEAYNPTDNICSINQIQ